jgi:hypothetical protein
MGALTLPVLAALTDRILGEIEQLITEGSLPAPNQDDPRDWRGPEALMAVAAALVAMPASVATWYASGVVERLARASAGLTGGPSPTARATAAVIARLALLDADNPVNRAMNEVATAPRISWLLNRAEQPTG